MKTKIKVEKEVNLKLLCVSAGARYWEDADVNGVQDDEGRLIPCRNGDRWEPVIDIDSGIITNWGKGTVASIHYKVCDDCNWKIIDDSGKEVKSVYREYVPGSLCPIEEGYGDYIIMEVNGDGKIKNWNFDVTDFFNELD